MLNLNTMGSFEIYRRIIEDSRNSCIYKIINDILCILSRDSQGYIQN